jgi:hypothetical protein
MQHIGESNGEKKSALLLTVVEVILLKLVSLVSLFIVSFGKAKGSSSESSHTTYWVVLEG